jgi:hypothetical protein
MNHFAHSRSERNLKKSKKGLKCWNHEPTSVNACIPPPPLYVCILRVPLYSSQNYWSFTCTQITCWFSLGVLHDWWIEGYVVWRVAVDRGWRPGTSRGRGFPWSPLQILSVDALLHYSSPMSAFFTLNCAHTLLDYKSHIIDTLSIYRGAEIQRQIQLQTFHTHILGYKCKFTE